MRQVRSQTLSWALYAGGATICAISAGIGAGLSASLLVIGVACLFAALVKADRT